MKQLFLGGISLGFHFYFFLAFGSLFPENSGEKRRIKPVFTAVYTSTWTVPLLWPV